MKKVTKGVLAAGLGVGLLVSGAGTLAYWTAEDTIGGGTINAGHLTLTAAAPCTDWVLDSGEDAPETYVDGDPIVPGDVLSRECTYTIGAEGNHLRATIGLDDPNFSGTDDDFLGMLDGSATASISATPVTEITEANDGDVLDVTVSLTFSSAADDLTQDMATVLDSILVTATQEHS